MSIIIMVALSSALEGICETITNINNAIDRKIKLMVFKQDLRRRRRGRRDDFGTRVRYKLESMYDNLITPK